MKKALFLALACAFLLAESDNSMSLEVGVGYLTSTFTGKQSGVRNFKGKGVSRGVDIYIGANVYTTERFGVTFGTGAEFLNGGWNDECSGASGGVSMYNYSYTRQVLNYYLAATADNSSQRYKEELAAIKNVAGDNYDTAFDKSIAYDSSKTGSQGYLYKSDKIQRDKYEIKYVEYKKEDGTATGGGYNVKSGTTDEYEWVGKNDDGTWKGQYSKETNYAFTDAGANNGSYTKETKDVYVDVGTGNGDYKLVDGTYTKVANGEKGDYIKQASQEVYTYVGEGKGSYNITQEDAYLYRYNGAVYDGRGLYCSTPKLNVKTWYAFIGVFYDVLKFENFGVRAFGNVGVGYDMMKDRFSRATYYLDYGSYQGYYTANSNETPSKEKGSVYLPITAGIRFVIAKNHGIELVGKYNLVKSKWKSTQSLFDGDFDGYNAPLPVKIDTKITRDYSWGIRYVYEFKKDEGYY